MTISFKQGAVAVVVSLAALSASAATQTYDGTGTASFSFTDGTKANGTAFSAVGSRSSTVTVSVNQWDPASFAGQTLTGIQYRVIVNTGTVTWGVDNDATVAYTGGQTIGANLSYTAEGVSGAYSAQYVGNASTAGISVTANAGDTTNINTYHTGGTDFQTGTATDTNGTSTWTAIDSADFSLFTGAGTVDFDFITSLADQRYNNNGLIYKFDVSSNYKVEVEYTYTATVPEPESYALMLAGLAALGVVSRRRRLS